MERNKENARYWLARDMYIGDGQVKIDEYNFTLN
jgi:hypothetical protein